MGLREWLAKAHWKQTFESAKIAAHLNAERAAAAASALDVRVVELEAGAFQCLDVIDGDALEVHLAHLVDQHLEAIELVDIVGGIFLVLKSHVIAEAGAASTHNGNAQGDGRGILLAHNFLNFRGRHWGNCNHFSIFTPCRSGEFPYGILAQDASALSHTVKPVSAYTHLMWVTGGRFEHAESLFRPCRGLLCGLNVFPTTDVVGYGISFARDSRQGSIYEWR